MKPSNQRSVARADILLFFLFLLTILVAGGCATSRPLAGKSSPSARIEGPRFSLLPKSFQSNPELDMTVFTEIASPGMKMPVPTPDHPVYYVLQCDGFRELGRCYAGEKSPAAANVQRWVRRALSSAGFQPVPSVEVRPELTIIYRWGTFHALDDAPDDQRDSADSDVIRRARLVGGKTFANKIARTIEWGDDLLDHDDKADFLREQAHNSCYFVVIYAYDYEGRVRGQNRLYWRTNMTVNTSGVSLKETLPSLIASAAPYLGRDMNEPAITSERLWRNEKIEIGEAIVLDDEPVVETPEARALAIHDKVERSESRTTAR